MRKIQYKLIQPAQAEIQSMLDIGGYWSENFAERLEESQEILENKTPYTSAKACLPFFLRHTSFRLRHNNNSDNLFSGDPEEYQPYHKRCAVVRHYLAKIHFCISNGAEIESLKACMDTMLMDSLYDVFFLHQLMSRDIFINEVNNAGLEEIARNNNIPYAPFNPEFNSHQQFQWRQWMIKNIALKRRDCRYLALQFIKQNKKTLHGHLDLFDQFFKEYQCFIIEMYREFKAKYHVLNNILKRLDRHERSVTLLPPIPSRTNCLNLFCPSKKNMCRSFLRSLPLLFELELPLSEMKRQHIFCFQAEPQIKLALKQSPGIQESLATARTRVQGESALYPLTAPEDSGQSQRTSFQ